MPIEIYNNKHIMTNTRPARTDRIFEISIITLIVKIGLDFMIISLKPKPGSTRANLSLPKPKIYIAPLQGRYPSERIRNTGRQTESEGARPTLHKPLGGDYLSVIPTQFAQKGCNLLLPPLSRFAKKSTPEHGMLLTNGFQAQPGPIG
jgi:hypothetical protein